MDRNDVDWRGYFEEVTASAALPCWLYNFPQGNATHLTLAQVGELVALPNVVFGNMLSRMGLAAIVGGDGHFGSGMPLGARMPRFFELAWKGEVEEAARIADAHAGRSCRSRTPTP